jgi:hypothetical protein
MRLPRRRFEQFCRVGAFALLGWLIGTSVFPTTTHRVEQATAADVSGRLEAWTRSAATIPLHGEFSVTPDAWIVDWLSALGRSGHAVSWSGNPPAVAMSLEAIHDPTGSTVIDVAAPPGARVVVRDDASVIDSVRVARLGARLVSPTVVGGITAMAGDQPFGAAPPDSVGVKAVVVIGEASWEGKFIVSALEERGWPVIAHFSVAPNVEVTQGTSGALVLDTSTVSAVVAIDTTIARYSDAVARFVRQGGGLVLAGPSSLTRSMASLAPGTLMPRYRPTVEPKDMIGLGATGFYPVTALKDDGIAIERRPAGISMAARRVGAGRVMQVGYDDSWRWRMAGGSGSAAAHRAWWSGVVASVAFAAGTSDTHAASGNEASAPLAWMVDRLGPARSGPPAGGSRGPSDRRIFITLIMILLLTEWTSRRLRGLR